MAKRRRKRLPERMTLRFPDVSRGRPRPEEPPVPEGADVLEGVAVSRGIAEGPVRVVLDRRDAEQLVHGEIMVALFTDIGWSPYYSRISGLVTEIGGALSHGAVVAREYGLPLVSGITGITRALKTGMRIRVDGGRGTVTIMDAEKETERETSDATV
jgi:pyruvate,water dikinase